MGWGVVRLFVDEGLAILLREDELNNVQHVNQIHLHLPSSSNSGGKPPSFIPA